MSDPVTLLQRWIRETRTQGPLRKAPEELHGMFMEYCEAARLAKSPERRRRESKFDVSLRKLVDEELDDIRWKGRKLTLVDWRDITQRIADRLTESLRAEHEKQLKQAYKAGVKNVASELGVPYGMVSFGGIHERSLATLASGQGVAETYAGFTRKLAAKLNNVVSDAYHTGQVDPARITQDMTDVAGWEARHRLKRIAHTETWKVWENARANAYKDAEAQFGERFRYRFGKIRDNRTCEMCNEVMDTVPYEGLPMDELFELMAQISRDRMGSGWNPTRDGPVPVIHPGCRHSVYRVVGSKPKIVAKAKNYAIHPKVPRVHPSQYKKLPTRLRGVVDEIWRNPKVMRAPEVQKSEKKVKPLSDFNELELPKGSWAGGEPIAPQKPAETRQTALGGGLTYPLASGEPYPSPNRYSVPVLNEWVPQHGITWMSPDEYAHHMTQGKGGMEHPDFHLGISQRSQELLQDRMRRGQPLDPLWLEYWDDGSLKGHEGRNRAYAAKKLGIAKVPVVVRHRQPRPVRKALTDSEENSTFHAHIAPYLPQGWSARPHGRYGTHIRSPEGNDVFADTWEDKNGYNMSQIAAEWKHLGHGREVMEAHKRLCDATNKPLILHTVVNPRFFAKIPWLKGDPDEYGGKWFYHPGQGLQKAWRQYVGPRGGHGWQNTEDPSDIRYQVAPPGEREPKRHIDSSVLRVLAQGGHEAYIVGGSVRDMMLGRKPKDIDITTAATPEQVMQWFQSQGYKVIPTGLQHGTVTVMDPNEGPVEITVFRTEGKYSDGRRPDEVQFTQRVEDDLARRDFTINAIAWDPVNGHIVDPFGGSNDLREGLIRAVGDPIARFTEDGLRPIRAARFAAQLGFRIDEHTFEAMKDPRVHTTVARVAQERIREETLKAMGSPNPRAYIEALMASGLNQFVVPELDPMAGMEQPRAYHAFDVLEHTKRVVEEAPKDPFMRWVALLHDIAKPDTFKRKPDGTPTFHGHEEQGAAKAEQIMQRLKFPSKDIERAKVLIRHHLLPYSPTMHDSAVRRIVDRVGVQNMGDLIELRRADLIGHGTESATSKLADLDHLKARLENMAERKVLTTPKLAISGHEIMALGVPEGAQVGAIMRRLRDHITERPDDNDPEVLLGLTREWVGKAESAALSTDVGGFETDAVAFEVQRVAKDWTREVGPKGAVRWRSTENPSDVRYQTAKPGGGRTRSKPSEEGEEAEGGPQDDQAPEATTAPSDASQGRARTAPGAQERYAERTKRILAGLTPQSRGLLASVLGDPRRKTAGLKKAYCLAALGEAVAEQILGPMVRLNEHFINPPVDLADPESKTAWEIKTFSLNSKDIKCKNVRYKRGSYAGLDSKAVKQQWCATHGYRLRTMVVVVGDAGYQAYVKDGYGNYRPNTMERVR